jgi:predicted outer membrane repeat protein
VDSDGGSVDCPTNDFCVNTIDISEGDTYFTTFDATTDGDLHASCMGDGQTYHDVWYNYIAPTSGTLTLSTCGQANYDTDLVVYEGNDCASLILLGCNDDTDECDLYTSYLEVPVYAGSEYLIRVGGWGNGDYGSGILTMTIDGDVVTWVGSDGGSWFDETNWSSGVVPTGGVDVEIAGNVNIDQSGAAALSVTVQIGGNLVMQPGSSLQTFNLLVETGGNLNWIGGTIDVSSGNMTLSQPLYVGCQLDATLLAKGTMLTADDVTICENGTLITTSWIFADSLSNMGTLILDSAVSDIGYIWMFGDYLQADTGRLVIDIASTGSGGSAFDYIGVDGNSSIDGTIELHSSNEFQPVYGNEFLIIDNTNDLHEGEFSDSLVVGFDAGISFSDVNDISGCTMSAFVTNVIFVDADNTSGNGTSWATAYPTLQEALATAGFGEQIWIAEGTYTPGLNRTDTFSLPYGVSIYGGFDGTETSTTKRDIAGHPTILTGDINNTPETDSDDVYHVVTLPSGYISSLDGLTITKGYANGNGANQSIGAGIYQLYGFLGITSCTIFDNYSTKEGAGVYSNGGATTYTNCLLDSNISAKNGGGIYATLSVTTLTGTTLTQNRILRYQPLYAEGGGMHVNGGTLTIDDCIFDNNSAFFGLGIADGGTGGALYAKQAITTITDTTFKNNRAFTGGGIYFVEISTSQIALINRCRFEQNSIYYHVSPYAVGGAAFKQVGVSQTKIVNSLFSGNDGEGTAIIDMGAQGGYTNKIRNCTITFNVDVGVEAAVTGSATLSNSILWYNTGTYNRAWWNQYNGSFLIDRMLIDNTPASHPTATNVDPLFRSARGPDGEYGTGDEDYRLLPGSIAIDRGKDSVYNIPNLGSLDLDGNERFVDDVYTDDYDEDATIDLGCYEYQAQIVGVSGFRSWKRTNPWNSSFDDDTKWEPAESPTVNDVAVILENLGPIEFNSNESIQRMIYGSGICDLELNSYTLAINANDDSLMIGHLEDIGFEGCEIGILNGTVIADRVDISGVGTGAMYFDNGSVYASNGFILRNDGAMYGMGTIYGNVHNSGTHQIDSINSEFPGVVGDYYMTDQSTPGLEGTGDIIFYMYDYSGNDALSSIAVSGEATLGGVLQLHGSGNILNAGDSATILNAAGGITSNFDSILAMGFSADEIPIVSIVANAIGGESVIVTMQSVSGLLGFGDPDATNINALPDDVELGDIDGDGFPDIVLSIPDDVDTAGDTDDIIIIYNGGTTNGEWNGFTGGSLQVTVGNKPAGLTLGDFDGDGDLDIAVVNTLDDTVSLLENETSARSIVSFSVTSVATDHYADDAESYEAKPTDVTHGQFSDSGTVDLAIANNGDGKMVIILGPLFAQGFMPSGPNQQTTGGAKTINPGDVNNDKDWDRAIVTGDDGESNVFKGGSGFSEGWENPIVLSMGSSVSEQLVEDLDQNGKDDLVVCDRNANTISIALQKSDGTYGSPARLELDAPLSGWYVSPRSVSTINIDDDSDLDLAVVAENENGVTVTIMFRNDSPVGGEIAIFTDIGQEEGHGLNPLKTRSADVDGDGYDDLLMITDTIAFRSAGAVGSTQTIVNDHTIGCYGDFNADGTVNVQDLLTLIAAWGPGNGAEDLNEDGTVNVADLLLLIGVWGECP